VKPPAGQRFSEIYVLGQQHTFDNIPFNVKAGVTYSVYLGVVNHMESSSYYTCLIKLGNENDLPNASLSTPSSLPTLYEYKPFLTDGATWEAPLTFQLNNLTFTNGTSQLSQMTINGINIPSNEIFTWNVQKTGYFCNLFVELWIFNSTLGISQYNNRFVSLNLNLTE
jgi:uncharacterized membrane protein